MWQATIAQRVKVILAVERVLGDGDAARPAAIEIALGKLTREGDGSPSVWLFEAAMWETRLRGC